MMTLGFAGYSGAGKTTLLTAIIPLLRRSSMRVAVIKTTHHDVEWDSPGKDSYRLREAGAEQVLLAGPRRWYWVRDFGEVREPHLDALVAALPEEADICLVEGLRDGPFPKIEVHRPALQKPLLATHDAWIRAVASDAPVATEVPVLPLNEPAAVADFILALRKERP